VYFCLFIKYTHDYPHSCRTTSVTGVGAVA
jgi:hypothetical protein